MQRIKRWAIIGICVLVGLSAIGQLAGGGRRQATATPAAQSATTPGQANTSTPVPPADTSSPVDPTATPMPAAPPIPTNAIAPVPTTHEGLVSLLLKPGDLPGEWRTKDGWIFDEPGVDYEGPKPVAVANASIEDALDPKNKLGNVEIYLLDSASAAEDVWRGESAQRRRNAGKGVTPYEPDYGDNAAFVPADDVVVLHTVIFQRCRAVSFLFMTGTEDEVNGYARRLDERLAATACP